MQYFLKTDISIYLFIKRINTLMCAMQKTLIKNANAKTLIQAKLDSQSFFDNNRHKCC